MLLLKSAAGAPSEAKDTPARSVVYDLAPFGVVACRA
jgi:hypothetical protein